MISDKVITKIKRVTFFLRHTVYHIAWAQNLTTYITWSHRWQKISWKTGMALDWWYQRVDRYNNGSRMCLDSTRHTLVVRAGQVVNSLWPSDMKMDRDDDDDDDECQLELQQWHSDKFWHVSCVKLNLTRHIGLSFLTVWLYLCCVCLLTDSAVCGVAVSVNKCHWQGGHWTGSETVDATCKPLYLFSFSLSQMCTVSEVHCDVVTEKQVC